MRATSIAFLGTGIGPVKIARYPIYSNAVRRYDVISNNLRTRVQRHF